MTPEQLTGKADTHLTELETPFQLLRVHHKVKQDLLKLIQAAQTAGFKLEVASGYRDYFRQKRIWDNKFNGRAKLLDSESNPLDVKQLTDKEKLFAILRWSALPGASRHHWGTDFDLYASNLLAENQSLQLEPWEYQTGHQAPLSNWLCQNAKQFGFFFPYGQDLGGVSVEPWHISHLAASKACIKLLSKAVIQQAIETDPISGRELVSVHLDTIYTQFITNINVE